MPPKKPPQGGGSAKSQVDKVSNTSPCDVIRLAINPSLCSPLAQVLTTTFSSCVLIHQTSVQHQTFMYLIIRKLYGIYIVNIYSPCTLDPSSNAVGALDMTVIFDDPPAYVPFYITTAAKHSDGKYPQSTPRTPNCVLRPVDFWYEECTSLLSP
jgi:hypothetical protein